MFPEEMFSFWHWVQKSKKGNQERREERLEIEPDQEEEIDQEE